MGDHDMICCLLCTHAYPHAHIPTYTHIYTCTPIHTYTTYAHMHKYTYTYAHTHAHIHSDQSTATVIVVHQPPPPTSFRDTPVLMTDSNGQQVMTRIEYQSGALTWLICCLVCWLTGCWCIALIPFCIDDTKDVYHYTPTDNKMVGVYKRL